MRVLVLGRSGQVARSLTERAAEWPGLTLVCAGRPELDLAEAGSAERLIHAFVPDLVINAAAYTAVDQAEDEPETAFRVNADAAGEAAAAARAQGAGLIHLSTDYVFDGRASEPYREDAPTSPLSVYGRSKLAGEEQARSAHPDAMVLRTSWVFSPFGRNFVKSIAAAAKERDRLTVVDDQHGSPTSALDLAGAILAIADGWVRGETGARGQTYHLAGAGSASWLELALQVMAECRKLGRPAAEVDPISTSQWPAKAVRPAYSVLDCTRIERELGMSLPDWRSSVARTVERLA